MRKRMTVSAAIAAVVMAGMIAIPAGVAGAAGGLWVSNSVHAGSAPGTSCAKPGYATVSAAVAAASPGATIHICAGTYTEQVVITKSLSLTAVGAVTLRLPATPVDTNTVCDNAVTANGYQAPQDELSLCHAGTVSITGVTVSAFWPALTCYDSLYGVFVGAGSNLDANSLDVNGAGVPIGDPDTGCQGGVGIQVGSARSATPQAGSATLKNVTVTGYQKNGINVTGTGATVAINKATVTGRGPVGTAENGIEVAFGAKGTISGATVSHNQCVLAGVCGPNSQTDTQATGVLFYQAAAGTTVTKSSISNNDNGVYYGSGAPTEPTSAEVTISRNTFSGTADEQILLDQGVASVINNTISGPGNVGIQVIQYAAPVAQTYAPASTANGDSISGQGVGVQVSSDNQPGDLPGKFTISHSTYLASNTVGQEDNSTNFVIQGIHNS
jgi:hypothetical protein